MAQFKYADLSKHRERDTIKLIIHYEIDFQDFEKVIPWNLK